MPRDRCPHKSLLPTPPPTPPIPIPINPQVRVTHLLHDAQRQVSSQVIVTNPPLPHIPINPQVRVTHLLHDAQRQVSSQVIVTTPPPPPHSNKPTGKSDTLTPWCPETGVLTSHCYQPPPPHSNKPTGKSGTLTPWCPETDRCPHCPLWCWCETVPVAAAENKQTKLRHCEQLEHALAGSAGTRNTRDL